MSPPPPSGPPESPGPWNDPQRWSTQQPTYGQGGYGADAVHGPRPEPPAPLATAVKLMWVGAATGVIGLILPFFQTDQMRDQLVEDNPRMTADEIDTAVNFGIGLGVVLGLVGVGLWVWMAVANEKGHNWARIVATVLGGLNIAMTALGLLAGAAIGQATDGLSMVFSLGVLVIAVLALVMLWQPASSQYYDAMERRRAQGLRD